MSTITSITQKAIKAAKLQNWEDALAQNTTLLDLEPHNVDALNRLGLAYIQLKNISQAKKTFLKVIEIDKANALAKKHLQRIKEKQTHSIPTFSNQVFIEEPGKTKTVQLNRLAEKEVLSSVAVGQTCELIPKKRFISVTVNATYIGALPEDVSFRLSALIRTGNTYSCHIRSLSQKHVSVFLKEIVCADQNKNIHSFPPGKGIMTPLGDVEDTVLLEENIPVQIVDIDTDTEKSLDDMRDSFSDD